MMNYEEMISNNDKNLSKTALLPLGFFHKKNVDGKYENVVDLKNHMSDDVKFRACVRAECEKNQSLADKHQLHFTLSSSGTALDVERGNFVTFEQLLTDNPSLVGRDSFIKSTLNGIFDAANYLHEQGIYHLCFAPSNIFVRKGDEQPLLLSHGSFYSSLPDQSAFYGDMQSFVAPEVLAGEAADERSDVYSIGKFTEWLFQMSSLPIEHKRVYSKAMAESPDDRYQSVDAMKAALERMTAMRRSTVTFIVTALIAFLIVGIYFFAVPEPQNMEYVKPVPEQSIDDILDDGFDPAELGIITKDTFELTPQQRKEMEEYEKKAEEIFRKRYSQEAERILSRIYNNANMSGNERKFMSGSQAAMTELVEKQMQLARDANISDTKSQKIASEIIEKITEEKKKSMK